MTSSGWGGGGEGFCQYSMFHDIFLEGEGVVSSYQRRHKDSQNFCIVIIVCKNSFHLTKYP